MNKADIAALAMPAADAVAWEEWEKWAEKSMEEFAIEVVRLYREGVDAERGKEAIGYDAIFKAIASATKTQGTQAGIEVSVKAFKEAIGGEIFLSDPTIPEGMVLVSVADLKALKSSISGDCYMGDLWEVAHINGMLAAAQGERK